MNMPNVVVHPPEEDHTEPWCCFDAAQPPSPDPYPHPSTSDIHFALETEHPDFHSNNPFAHQGTPLRRSPNQRSVFDAYQSHDPYLEDEYDDDVDDALQRELEDARREYHSSVPSSSAGNDSEIVEVVKVRRSKHEPVYDNEEEQPPPKSSSFRSRASKAFRSLAGSLRSSSSSSSSSKHRSAQDVFAAETPEDRPCSPTISRRGSGMLSQLFNAPGTSLKSRSSVSSFDDSPNSPPATSPTEPQAPFPSSRSSSSMLSRTSSILSSRRSSIYTEHRSRPLDEDARAPSPAPTTATATKRKFSRLNLRKVFSRSFSASSSSSASVPDTSSGRTTPTLASSAGPQTPTSTDSGEGADEGTPRPVRKKSVALDRERTTGGDVRLDFGPGGELQLSDPRVSSGTGTATGTANAKGDADADVSFEMRLDSLHFDELSFDADRFTVAA